MAVVGVGLSCPAWRPRLDEKVLGITLDNRFNTVRDLHLLEDLRARQLMISARENIAAVKLDLSRALDNLHTKRGRG